MISQKIQAECPKCGGRVAADSFVLDYLERKMVCPGCFKKARKPSLKESTEKQKEVVKKQKPPGWDKEDELLEQLVRARKDKLSGSIQRVPGKDYVKYTCPCSFTFRYFPVHKKPRTCPYCNRENPRIKQSVLR